MPCAADLADARAVDAAPCRRVVRRMCAALLAVHIGLLAWSAARHSPTFDETGFMVAGLSHWMLGRFDLYPVNPPLVRMVATAPVLAFRPEVDWSGYEHAQQTRPEYWIGWNFQLLHKDRAVLFFALARWACIPFSVLGAWICFRWAKDLYGPWAGLIALTLWCSCPNILAHGALISADAGAAALGVAAGYCYWRWLKHAAWHWALLAGLTLGLALLAKLTLLVVFGLWPALWLARIAGPGLARLVRHRGCRGRCLPLAAIAQSHPPCHGLAGPAPSPWRGQIAQLLVILTVAIVLINAGYGFEGSFQPLGKYRFASSLLGGGDSHTAPAEWGNRFAGSWLAHVPVPLPENYLWGIDRQRRDFEMKMWSYLRGEWRFGGWWYYYLYGLLIKEPLGVIALLILAMGLPWGLRGRSPGWAHECVVLAPAVVILALVSSQTGFNHHLRYVLPAMPFLFIWMSRASLVLGTERTRWTAAAIVAALAWSAASSLWVYPHSLSYFNELVGGPRNGHRHLLDSNIDWGQDLLYLKRWCHAHPEARPLRLAYFGSAPFEIAALDDVLPLPTPDRGAGASNRFPSSVPETGWYAASVHLLQSSAGPPFASSDLRYLLQLQPVASAGYSIRIYHITAEDAERLRREMGLPPLSQPPTPRAK